MWEKRGATYGEKGVCRRIQKKRKPRSTPPMLDWRLPCARENVCSSAPRSGSISTSPPSSVWEPFSLSLAGGDGVSTIHESTAGRHAKIEIPRKATSPLPRWRSTPTKRRGARLAARVEGGERKGARDRCEGWDVTTGGNGCSETHLVDLVLVLYLPSRNARSRG